MRLVQTWSEIGGAPAGWERHCPILWNKWEYAAGKYDFAGIDRMLAAQDTPCHLQIIISMYGKATSLVDYTPGIHKHSLKLTASNGKTGEIPDYANADWQRAYQAAVASLAARYKDHPQVVGYWHALGLNQETQATASMYDGTDWNAPAAKLLAEQGYYDWIVASIRDAVKAWGAVPVYVPGAPNPGTTWGRGRSRRIYVQNALRAGGRYQMCGLLPDNSNATGLGEQAGYGLTDIILATGAACAFEGGKEAGPEPWELYWLLLRAAHWDADFVDLQRSWTPHAPTVLPFVPKPGSRWLVFRDAESAAQCWTGGDGKLYGQSGEEDSWGRGLEWEAGGQLTFDPARFDWGRWRLAADVPVRLRAPGLADGRYEVTVYVPPDRRESLAVDVCSELFDLPAGTYHRVDVGDLVEPVAVQPTLLETLREQAEAHDLLAVNEDAALCKAAAARGLWPTSNEFEVVYGGVTYVAQRFRQPRSKLICVLYAVRDQWETIHELQY